MSARAIVYSNDVGQMRLLVQVAFQFEATWSSPEVAKVAKEFVDLPLDTLNLNDPGTATVPLKIYSGAFCALCCG